MNQQVQELALPEALEAEMLVFLDDLREEGVTNMFGAGPYLEAAYGLAAEDARKVLAYWMKTFGVR